MWRRGDSNPYHQAYEARVFPLHHSAPLSMCTPIGALCMAVRTDDFTLGNLGKNALNRPSARIRRGKFLPAQVIKLHHIERVLNAAIGARFILCGSQYPPVPLRRHCGTVSVFIPVGAVMLAQIFALSFPILIGH